MVISEISPQYFSKKIEEKKEFKNLEWLKHQYYFLRRNVQDIADDQGVSMITIRKWLDKLENNSNNVKDKK